MAINSNGVKTAQQYLDSAAPDEPVFVLMGRDPLAAEVVRFWVWLAEMKRLHSSHSREKIDLAITHVERLQAWADYVNLKEDMALTARVR